MTSLMARAGAGAGGRARGRMTANIYLDTYFHFNHIMITIDHDYHTIVPVQPPLPPSVPSIDRRL